MQAPNSLFAFRDARGPFFAGLLVRIRATQDRTHGARANSAIFASSTAKGVSNDTLSKRIPGGAPVFRPPACVVCASCGFSASCSARTRGRRRSRTGKPDDTHQGPHPQRARSGVRTEARKARQVRTWFATPTRAGVSKPSEFLQSHVRVRACVTGSHSVCCGNVFAAGMRGFSDVFPYQPARRMSRNGSR